MRITGVDPATLWLQQDDHAISFRYRKVQTADTASIGARSESCSRHFDRASSASNA